MSMYPSKRPNQIASGLQHCANDKPIYYIVVPTWIDDVLLANGLDETILEQHEKLKSILTAEDIKFYNENITKIYEIRHLLPIPRDIHVSLSSLYGPEAAFGLVSSNQKNESLRNSISVKEGLAPFVRVETDNIHPWGIIAQFSINRMVDRNLVVIRFVQSESGCGSDQQAKENEKLAEFIIGEYGVEAFANTELFNKILAA